MEKKAREKTQGKPLLENQVWQRAAIIMKVRCGLMTATEAAALLGVSRKTYYKWEQRGLAALLEGLQEQTGGRPEIPQQQRRVAEIEKQVAQLQQPPQSASSSSKPLSRMASITERPASASTVFSSPARLTTTSLGIASLPCPCALSALWRGC